MTQKLWDAAKGVLTEIYSNTILHQERRNISNKQPNLTPKAVTERGTKIPQSWQKERIHKDQIRNK